MPKRAQDYESDGGFVEDAPKNKKPKSGGNQLKMSEGKTQVSTQMQKDEDGNEFWELSRTRRIGISTFKNATMMNIREYYEKDGRQGITLSIDQFSVVMDVLPQIESTLKSKGITISHPKYDGGAAEAGSVESEEEDEEKVPDDEQDAKPSRLDKFRMRPNHEATSDEDGD
ncbi:hypothetical protein EJ03DRAFT_350516 [Teratosphaeria nubilosa]|uniref:Transcriptional coactivator p15 (PC4) C-terminal domain-containing protein n=1 Tax=Teratosphaeria nubilosa TaxID=161662 RepID=A0A6G1LE54_9PEZI|nr:hypothetical protein EJ03DRAFT_350516 [Teratosphaeria nubilosa]